MVDFAVPTPHSVKIKEREKRYNYTDLPRELKKNKPWSMNVTVIPIVVRTLGTNRKSLLKRQEDLEIRGEVEYIQPRILFRLARIPKKPL